MSQNKLTRSENDESDFRKTIQALGNNVLNFFNRNIRIFEVS
jgi:hypothetical protein